jgi:hypothetical protein
VVYTISSFTLGGTNAADFQLQTNTCTNGTALAAGANCSFTVVFRPVAAGARSATVNIATTANLNPTPTVSLKGTGTQVNLSTTSLTFAPQVVGK